MMMLSFMLLQLNVFGHWSGHHVRDSQQFIDAPQVVACCHHATMNLIMDVSFLSGGIYYCCHSTVPSLNNFGCVTGRESDGITDPPRWLTGMYT